MFLQDHYPPVSGPYRYLNSGGFIGYASDLYRLVTLLPVADLDDDQGYYSKIYLDAELRAQLKIGLDTRCEIFQNLNGAENEMRVRFRDKDAYVLNQVHGTEPLVVHGNGPTKVTLNGLGNYLVKSWTPSDGCMACAENRIALDELARLPLVTVALFVEMPTPFLREFLDNVASINYPKERINLVVHNRVICERII